MSRWLRAVQALLAGSFLASRRVLEQVNIALREWDRDTILIEGLLDVLGEVEVDIPIQVRSTQTRIRMLTDESPRLWTTI